MNFLPVTSDMQTLEFAYSLHSSVSKQYLSFKDCTDLSLGLVETNGLTAVLSAQASLTRLEDAIITLRKIELETLEDSKGLVRLEPLQRMNLHFELGNAVIGEIPLMLPESTPYYSLVQHLIVGRLEGVLAEMDVFYLGFGKATMTEKLTELLRLRAYRYSGGMYSKFLLMTHTANVLP